MATGFAAPGWGAVRDGFLESHTGQPGGAQLAIYRDGELVVDLWTGEGWRADSLGLLMSVSKALTAISIHRLAERGALELGAPAARYWPEFGANGKDGITLAHLLSHQAGIPSFPEGAGIDEATILDPRYTARAVAAMRPLWRPGSATFYHAVTAGFVLGEIVRRVTGCSLGTFFAEDIARPLDLDLWIGAPPAVEARLRPAFVAVPWMGREQWDSLFESFDIDAADPVAAALLRSVDEIDTVIELLGTRKGRGAEIPAAGGIGDARSLARLFAAMLGPVDGVRLLGETSLEHIATPPATTAAPPPLDRIPADSPARFGLGFEFPRDGIPMLGEGSFGHAGAGGRLAFVHPQSKVAAAFVCDALIWDGATPDPRWSGWTEALDDIAKGNG